MEDQLLIMCFVGGTRSGPDSVGQREEGQSADQIGRLVKADDPGRFSQHAQAFNGTPASHQSKSMATMGHRDNQNPMVLPSASCLSLTFLRIQHTTAQHLEHQTWRLRRSAAHFQT